LVDGSNTLQAVPTKFALSPWVDCLTSPPGTDAVPASLAGDTAADRIMEKKGYN
jgi:hypothetical protein